MERTLILLKPDAVQRHLIGEILGRFERKGLKIVGLKLVRVSQALAEAHYSDHREKKFFKDLVTFLTSSPLVALVLEGNKAVSVARNLIGATNGAEAAPGTIRGDFALSIQNNLVHGSDSIDNAQKEIALWFKAEEIVEWAPDDNRWVAV